MTHMAVDERCVAAAGTKKCRECPWVGLINSFYWTLTRVHVLLLGIVPGTMDVISIRELVDRHCNSVGWVGLGWEWDAVASGRRTSGQDKSRWYSAMRRKRESRHGFNLLNRDEPLPSAQVKASDNSTIHLSQPWNSHL